MAPAYEYYWPNDQQTNQVVIDRQELDRLKGHSDSSENIFENNDQDSESLNEIQEDPRSNRIRNLIPKPMRGSAAIEAARQVSHRALVRDLRMGEGKMNRRQSKRAKSVSDRPEDESDMTSEKIGEPSDQNGETADETNAAANGHQIERDTEAEVDDNPEEEEQSSVNLNVVNDNNIEERSDRLKKASYSPVYPPGDLDILYSDALLVYVKDFNHFI